MLKQNLHFKFLPRGPKTQLLLYWSAIKGPPKGSNSTMTNDQTSGRTHVNKCLWSRFNTQQLDKSPNEYITVGLKPFWSRNWNVLTFRFSEKATKIWLNLPLVLVLPQSHQNKWESLPNFCGLFRKPEL